MSASAATAASGGAQITAAPVEPTARRVYPTASGGGDSGSVRQAVGDLAAARHGVR